MGTPFDIRFRFIFASYFRMGGIPAVNGKGERLLLYIGIIDILQSYRWSLQQSCACMFKPLGVILMLFTTESTFKVLSLQTCSLYWFPLDIIVKFKLCFSLFPQVNQETGAHMEGFSSWWGEFCVLAHKVFHVEHTKSKRTANKYNWARTTQSKIFLFFMRTFISFKLWKVVFVCIFPLCC